MQTINFQKEIQQDDKQIDGVKYAIEIVSILKPKTLDKTNQPELPSISDDQSAGPNYMNLVLSSRNLHPGFI